MHVISFVFSVTIRCMTNDNDQLGYFRLYSREIKFYCNILNCTIMKHIYKDYLPSSIAYSRRSASIMSRDLVGDASMTSVNKMEARQQHVTNLISSISEIKKYIQN